jgi:hypothetical protein
LSGIEGSLKRLDRISIIILQATESSLARRILAYAEQARNESYEERVNMVLRYRFQNALPEELRILIHTSILHRYYRIQYRRKHRTEETPRWEVRPQHAPEPVAEPQTQPIATHRPAAMDEPMDRSPQRYEARFDAKSEPLTVDEGVIEEKLKEGLSAPPSRKPVDSASVSETGDALYPKAPEIREGQSKGTCPICLKEYDAGIFEGLKWRYG